MYVYELRMPVWMYSWFCVRLYECIAYVYDCVCSFVHRNVIIFIFERVKSEKSYMYMNSNKLLKQFRIKFARTNVYIVVFCLFIRNLNLYSEDTRLVIEQLLFFF